MSYLKTTEEINTTHIVEHPTQLVETKEENEPIIAVDPIRRIMAQGDPGYEQPDWIKYASKEKDYTGFAWGLSSTSNLFTLNIKLASFLNVMPIASNVQNLFTFDYLVWKIMPTVNANFQGLARICYYAFPDENFENRNGLTLDAPSTRRVVSIDLTPSNTRPIILRIPNTLPFHWYRFDDSYLMNYMLGKIVIQVLSPLATKSTLTGLAYTTRVYFEGFRTTGNNVS